MDYTILRQFSRRGRLEALLHSAEKRETQYLDLVKLLVSDSMSGDDSGQQLSDNATKKALRNSEQLQRPIYEQILNRLNKDEGARWKAHDAYPHNFTDSILKPYAQKLTQFHHEGKTFSTLTSHEGNSAIQFWSSSREKKLTGNIMLIYGMFSDNKCNHFLFVQLHRHLPNDEEKRAPFASRPEFCAQIVDANPSNELMVVRPNEIITHLAVYPRPAGTFGIPRNTKIISWSLDRGRRG